MNNSLENQSDNPFPPGLTERLEEARRREQRRLGLMYAFSSPALRETYDINVGARLNRSGEIEFYILPNFNREANTRSE